MCQKSKAGFNQSQKTSKFYGFLELKEEESRHWVSISPKGSQVTSRLIPQTPARTSSATQMIRKGTRLRVFYEVFSLSSFKTTLTSSATESAGDMRIAAPESLRNLKHCGTC
jgi:hypothetical protein